MTSFPAFSRLFVQTVCENCRAIDCVYNKKKISRWLEDMNFIFLCKKTIFSHNILPLENKIHIFAQLCNILYIFSSRSPMDIDSSVIFFTCQWNTERNLGVIGASPFRSGKPTVSRTPL